MHTFYLATDTTADVLLVGGGGSGGNYGGGGGGGDVVCLRNQRIPRGRYRMVVGAGGAAQPSNHAHGFAGESTVIECIEPETCGQFYLAAAGGGAGGGCPCALQPVPG